MSIPFSSSAAVIQNLDLRQQDIAVIAALTAKGDMDALGQELSKGLDDKLTINEIKEVLVQMYAYCGFPRSLNALNTFKAIVEERQRKGLQDEVGSESDPLPTDKSSYSHGKAVQTILVGQAVEGGVYDFAPVINDFLRSHLFGDIFGRNVLDYQSRELATIGALASMEGLETQLRSHLRVSLNVGLTESQLYGFVEAMQGRVGATEGLRARHALNEILNKVGTDIGTASTQRSIPQQKNVFPKGSLYESETFSGDAWLQWLVSANDGYDCTIGNVTFSPGCRNNWHSHTEGQILLCISGKGYYQEKGSPIQLLNPGDVVKIAPNVVHWHGASPSSEFTHIAIGPESSKNKVTWLSPVTDEEYNSLICQ